MTMITPSYLGETIEYSSLHACRSTLEDPTVNPVWPAIGAMAALVAVGILAARIPRGAVPRLPQWFWIAVGAGGALQTVAGGAPVVHVAGVAVGLGALDDWARITALAAVVLSAAALLSWTTPVGRVAPALSVLGRPVRRLGVPVDEWATAIGLCFRCLPLLVDEVRTLAAVRRLRAPHHHVGRRDLRRALAEPHQLLTAALVVALRRAGELAAAMDARGGVAGGNTSADRSRPGLTDAAFLLAVAAAVAFAVVAR